MVNHADCLIAMVWRNYGEAYQTLKYAEKYSKKIFRIELQNSDRPFKLSLGTVKSRRIYNIRTESATHFFRIELYYVIIKSFIAEEEYRIENHLSWRMY